MFLQLFYVSSAPLADYGFRNIESFNRPKKISSDEEETFAAYFWKVKLAEVENSTGNCSKK